MENAQPRSGHLGQIWAMADRLSEAHNLASLLETALEQTMAAVSAQAGTLWFRTAGDAIHPVVCKGEGSQTVSGMCLRLGEGIAGQVIATGQGKMLRDAREDAQWSARFDENSGFVTRSMICTPVISGNHVSGCIQLLNKGEDGCFDSNDLALCDELAGIAGYALEKSGFTLPVMEERPWILRTRGMGRVYGSGDAEVQALRNVSVEIRQGELLVILGSSGSGKSTLLNILGGMDNPTSGCFETQDQDLSAADASSQTQYRRHVIGFVFQAYNLIPDLTALENVTLAARLAKKPLMAEAVLEQVGLKDRMHHFPHQMSGGEQQRVSIARALVKQPAILLCDEPTGALDHSTGKQVLMLLEELARKQGQTVVIVTHNPNMAVVADRVIHMRSGAVTQVTYNPRPVPAERIEL